MSAIVVEGRSVCLGGGPRGRGSLSPGHRAVQRRVQLLLRRECGSSHHIHPFTSLKVSIARFSNGFCSILVGVIKKRTPLFA